MKRYMLHAPFSIYHFETDQWTHSVHKHTYFEIIFIIKGSGIHLVNGNAYEYSGGDVFLLGPEDFHHFDIKTSTEFSFVRFNEAQHTNISGNEDSQSHPVIQSLLKTSSLSRGSIVKNEQDQFSLHQLLMVLESEDSIHRKQYGELVRDNLMRSILIILARNLNSQDSDNNTYSKSIEKMLRYVKQNIFFPEKLNIIHLANAFNYSPAYVSILFKKETGESLKKYIVKLKIKLIESRLKNSELSLSDIADEFGYTDESHLCKQFKLYTGLTPNIYRKEQWKHG